MSSPPASEPSVSVVIPTYNRPDYLRECLRHLASQTVSPRAVIVVDASPDDRTQQLVSQHFPDVAYRRNPLGSGTTATSRAMGLELVETDIVAFVDDDAYARPDWLAELLRPYAEPEVGAVGGRVQNGTRDEREIGAGQIGMFLPNGTLVGNFAADPGRPVEVDHLLGANMSYRTAILRANGGIHDHYPGTCMREETDIALRVRAAGWRLVFTPAALVQHVEGPYAKGNRFDLRYTYFSHRNHMVLLSQIVGLGSARSRGYLRFATHSAASELRASLKAARRVPADRSAARAVLAGPARASTIVAGIAGGSVAAVRARADRAGADRAGR